MNVNRLKNLDKAKVQKDFIAMKPFQQNDPKLMRWFLKKILIYFTALRKGAHTSATYFVGRAKYSWCEYVPLEKVWSSEARPDDLFFQHEAAPHLRKNRKAFLSFWWRNLR